MPGISRRDLGRAAAGLPLLRLPVSSGPPEQRFTRLRGGVLEWTAANGALEQRWTLREGAFRCTSLRHLSAKREWIHPFAGSDEFHVQLASSRSGPVALTGESGWNYESHDGRDADAGWQGLSIVLRAAKHPLRITRFYRWRNDLAVMRQWMLLENLGNEPWTVTRLDALRLRLSPAPAPLELRWINNFGRAMLPSPGNPIHSRSIDENVEQLVRTGPYSPDCAWFSLAIPGVKEGMAGGWEWSGPVTVGFGGGKEPCLISGGLDPEGMAEPLPPGGVITSPASWYGFFEGDQDDAAELSHKLVTSALGPVLPARGFPWAGYCTWAAALDEKKNRFNESGTHPWFATEKNVLSQVEAAADLGCELFLWDYGWFPRVGDWWFDRSRFPQGPKPVARAVHGRGMKLGLWFGFGNADDDSQVLREHPEWRAEYKGKPIPDDFFIRTGASTWNTRIVCLAHRPAREWVKQQLARVIEEAELDWFKHDFDLITICQARHHTHTPGDSRIAACESFYEIMDFIRGKYPRLVCEHWMNDSATPDYGVLQRHHVQLIGDAYQSFLLRQMVYGHLQIFPLDRQHRYLRLEDSEGDVANVLQSSMLGGPWTLLSDPRLMTPDQRRIVEREIGFYKRFRRLFHSGHVYRLIARPSRGGWDALQVWDEHAGEGALYVFRNEHPAVAHAVRLRGLRSRSDYRVEFVRGGRVANVSGHALSTDGLLVELAKPNTAELIAITSAAR